MQHLRTWFLVDLIAAVPWSSFGTGHAWSALEGLRVIRVVKARQSFPVVVRASQRCLPPLSWEAKAVFAIAWIFVLVNHLNACALGASVWHSALGDLPSFLSNQLGVEPGDVDPSSTEAYIWAVYWSVNSFVSVGGLTAHNQFEAVVVMIVLFFCMVCFGFYRCFFDLGASWLPKVWQVGRSVLGGIKAEFSNKEDFSALNFFEISKIDTFLHRSKTRELLHTCWNYVYSAEMFRTFLKAYFAKIGRTVAWLLEKWPNDPLPHPIEY